MEQYLEEHIEGAIWAVFACADDRLVINHISTIQITYTSGTWNVNSQQLRQVLGILIQHCRVRKFLF